MPPNASQTRTPTMATTRTVNFAYVRMGSPETKSIAHRGIGGFSARYSSPIVYFSRNSNCPRRRWGRFRQVECQRGRRLTGRGVLRGNGVLEGGPGFVQKGVDAAPVVFRGG